MLTEELLPVHYPHYFVWSAAQVATKTSVNLRENQVLFIFQGEFMLRTRLTAREISDLRNIPHTLTRNDVDGSLRICMAGNILKLNAVNVPVLSRVMGFLAEKSDGRVSFTAVIDRVESYSEELRVPGDYTVLPETARALRGLSRMPLLASLDDIARILGDSSDTRITGRDLLRVLDGARERFGFSRGVHYLVYGDSVTMPLFTAALLILFLRQMEI